MAATVTTAAAIFFFTTISLDEVNVTLDPDIGLAGAGLDVRTRSYRYD
jgi:hypothetical protein